MEMMVLMFGPPNSGKGTYGKRLSKLMNVPFISAGELVREKLREDEGWFEGRYSQEIYDEGKLVPADLMVRLIRESISASGGRCVIDGYPRNLSQLAEFSNAGYPYVLVNVDQDDEVLIERAMKRMTCAGCGEIYAEGNPYMSPLPDGTCGKCGGVVGRRSDDTQEAVAKRLNIYREETYPVLDALSIDAEETIRFSPHGDDVDAFSVELHGLLLKFVDEE